MSKFTDDNKIGRITDSEEDVTELQEDLDSLRTSLEFYNSLAREGTSLKIRLCPPQGGTSLKVRLCPPQGGTSLKVRLCPPQGGTLIKVRLCPSQGGTSLKVRLCPPQGGTSLKVRLCPSQGGTSLKIRLCPPQGGTSLKIRLCPSQGGTSLKIRLCPSQGGTSLKIRLCPSTGGTSLKYDCVLHREGHHLSTTVSSHREGHHLRVRLCPSQGGTSLKIRLCPSQGGTSLKIRLCPSQGGTSLKDTTVSFHREGHHLRSESPVSPRERFQDARDKFRSLERDWQRSDRPECHARPQVHAGVCRTPSWEHKPGAGGRDTRAPHEHATRDEGVWPKSDRDTGYGSRDGLLRERPRGREYDRGYGTCDTRDSEPWHCAGSPSRVPRGRSPTKDYRVPRVKSPERPDYHRAKSMHDLNQRSVNEDDPRSCNDPRRRSMYDTAEDPRPLRESRSDRRYRSQASLRRRNSCSSGSCPSVDSYNEIPDTRRFPGLDRATARPDPLETTRGPTHFIHVNKRTYDYPVNGGTAAVHINRAQHDDYRRFRYDHTTTPQFIRTTSVPAAHY
nr:uncharacterized protein LOC128703962 [Cherax quadricarinatus]